MTAEMLIIVNGHDFRLVFTYVRRVRKANTNATCALAVSVIDHVVTGSSLGVDRPVGCMLLL